MKSKMEILEEIAARKLDIVTLQPRHLDILDFYDCAVWRIKEALELAYEAGAKAEGRSE